MMYHASSEFWQSLRFFTNSSLLITQTAYDSAQSMTTMVHVMVLTNQQRNFAPFDIYIYTYFAKETHHSNSQNKNKEIYKST